MAEDRLKTWETLFQRALALIDSVAKAGANLDPWSFGGGTVLMLRHRHRFSKDIDIFVPDPQYPGPRKPPVEPSGLLNVFVSTEKTPAGPTATWSTLNPRPLRSWNT